MLNKKINRISNTKYILLLFAQQFCKEMESVISVISVICLVILVICLVISLLNFYVAYPCRLPTQLFSGYHCTLILETVKERN